MTSRKVIGVFCLLFALNNYGRWMIPETKKVPIDRVIENLQMQQALNPNDAKIAAALGRIHSMAYATKIAEIDLLKTNDMPWFGVEPLLPPDDLARRYTTNQIKSSSTNDSNESLKQFLKQIKTKAERETAKAHLTNAIRQYAKALNLTNESLIYLGLGWCHEENGNKAYAIASYRAGLELAWKQDRNNRFIFDPPTVEIIRYLRPLLDPKTNKVELQKLAAYEKAMANVSRAYTPIVIPLGKNDSLEALVDHTATVHFDLGGLGPKQYGWITPEAGWLVYDSEGSGKITSGLQMFGNVTFWMFWKNGYEALSALDDDLDGTLSGAELNHISIWRDLNSNGISESEEVLPLNYYRIVALNTSYEIDSTGMPWSKSGASFKDGSVRPTYDVILHPKQNSSPRTH